MIVLALSAAACASTGATPRPFPVPGRAAGVPAAAGTGAGSPLAADAYALTSTALSFRGVPYRNGGADPGGFDCSGFVWYVFGQHGIPTPRTVSDLFRAGGDASGPLQPGDLVFFSTVAPGPTHVGIAIGGDEFVHAPSSTGVVRVERVSTPYWAARYLGARRIL